MVTLFCVVGIICCMLWWFTARNRRDFVMLEGADARSATDKRDFQRCFLMLEGNDATSVMDKLQEIRAIGANSPDYDTLTEKLSSVGRIQVSKFSDHWVIHVSLLGAGVSDLDRIVKIDSFSGSPAGLLKRLSKDAEVRWTGPRALRLTAVILDGRDYTSRIVVKDFQGTVRELLARIIPKTYATLALMVICNSDKVHEVNCIGRYQQAIDKFPADHANRMIAVGEPLTPSEREAEGYIMYKLAGETDEEYTKRTVKKQLSDFRQ